MINEGIFLLQSILVSCTALLALRLGKEALVTFVCIQCLLANFFVTKQVGLFGLTATASDAFTIGATLGLNMLQEYFGKKITRTTIWINFLMLIFYAIISQIHVWYIPAFCDTTQNHYVCLLGQMPRIIIASFTVYFIAQTVDFYVYGFLKRTSKGKFLVLRNYGSMLISQLIDTILFSFLGLYGIVHNIGHVIVMSYAIKVAAIFLSGLCMKYSLKISPRHRKY